MRTPALLPAALACLFVACGSESKAPAPTPAKKAEAPKPPDEGRYLPLDGLVDSKVVDDHLLGKAFMPGGTVGRYKKGKTEYEIFIRRLATPLDAAVILPDWSKALAGSKLVPGFGGYFGDDGGRPVFVFAKGPWIAGIAGLHEKQADLEARMLATKLP